MVPPFCLLKPKGQRKTGVVLDLAGWSQSKALCGGTKWIKWVGQAHSGCRQLVTASCSTCSAELGFWTEDISEAQAVPLRRVASPTGARGVQAALSALCQVQLKAPPCHFCSGLKCKAVKNIVRLKILTSLLIEILTRYKIVACI